MSKQRDRMPGTPCCVMKTSMYDCMAVILDFRALERFQFNIIGQFLFVMVMMAIYLQVYP